MCSQPAGRFDVEHDDREGIARRAEEWLLRREAENNLALSLLPRLRNEVAKDDYLALVQREGEVIGCAFRTPPFKLGLTRMPIAAVDPLAEDVASVYEELPAAFGPEAVAMAFGSAWTRRVGGSFAPGMRMRLHRLDRVIPLSRPAAGRLRPASDEDRELIFRWAEAFARETRSVVLGQRDRTAAMFGQGEFHVWEDSGRVRSMLAAMGDTQRGVRIGYVYTPQEYRAHGYATSAVAAISKQLLHAGREFCILYTDLANPTSNQIYASIGYEPLTDVMDVVFES